MPRLGTDVDISNGELDQVATSLLALGHVGGDERARRLRGKGLCVKIGVMEIIVAAILLACILRYGLSNTVGCALLTVLIPFVLLAIFNAFS